MKKFYSPRSTSTSNDPEKAFSRMDIQRLLNGRKDPITPGFGSIDLFNNPKLRKKTKKITSKEILAELEEIKQKRMPRQYGMLNPHAKQQTIVLPMKFTFKDHYKESDSNL